MKRLPILAAVAALSLAGCATLNGAGSLASGAVQLGVEESTAALIQTNCAPGASSCYALRAMKLQGIVSVLTTAATMPGASVASLQAAANAQIASLAPQEQIAAGIFLSQVLTLLQQQAGAGVLGAAGAAAFGTIAGWVNSAAGLYLVPPAATIAAH